MTWCDEIVIASIWLASLPLAGQSLTMGFAPGIEGLVGVSIPHPHHPGLSLNLNLKLELNLGLKS